MWFYYIVKSSNQLCDLPITLFFLCFQVVTSCVPPVNYELVSLLFTIYVNYIVELTLQRWNICI